MIRNVISDLKKIIRMPSFYVAVFAACLIFFCSYGGVDQLTGDKMMVFELVGNNKMLSDNPMLSAFEIFKNVNGIGFEVFLSVIAAIPFVSIHLEEMNSGMSRFMLIRQNKKKYYMGKAVTSFVSGGLVCLSAYCIFGIFVFLCFPVFESYSDDKMFLVRGIYEGYTPVFKNVLFEGRYLLPILILLGQMFLLGGTVSMFALFFSAIIRNIYIVACLPFFVFYTWYHLSLYLLEKTALYNIKLPVFIYDFLCLTKNSYFLNGICYPQYKIKVMVFQLLICTVMLSGYYYISVSKIDVCE